MSKRFFFFFFLFLKKCHYRAVGEKKKRYYRIAHFLKSQNPKLFFHPLTTFQMFIMRRNGAVLSVVKHVVKSGAEEARGRKRTNTYPSAELFVLQGEE